MLGMLLYVIIRNISFNVLFNHKRFAKGFKIMFLKINYINKLLNFEFEIK
jgi:hypothetical protein